MLCQHILYFQQSQGVSYLGRVSMTETEEEKKEGIKSLWFLLLTRFLQLTPVLVAGGAKVNICLPSWLTCTSCSVKTKRENSKDCRSKGEKSATSVTLIYCTMLQCSGFSTKC